MSCIYVHSMICAPTNRMAAGEPLGKNVGLRLGREGSIEEVFGFVS